MSTLLLVGHGSRDARSAGELRGLADRVRDAVPGDTSAFGGESACAGSAFDEVRLAFLELSEPVLEDVLADVSGEVVVVPLLLAAAFHARSDLPGRLAAVEAARPDLRIVRADVLGPDALLDDAVAARGHELLRRGCDALMIVGTGSSRAAANAEVSAVGECVAARLGAAVEVAFAAGSAAKTSPIDGAVRALRAQGAERIGVVPWFLAPGLLLDAGLARAGELGATDHADSLASDPRLVDLVLTRAATARATTALAG